MSHRESVTPQAAMLRVLINGATDASDIARKVRDWTEGRIELDPPGLEQAVRALEGSGLIERQQGAPDKRTGEPRETYALTPAGRASAVEILAESLIEKP
jgi:DNA-binding PadR family transcriptional regulator